MAKNDELFGFDDDFDLNSGNNSSFDFDSAFGDAASGAGELEDDGFGDLGSSDNHNRKATVKTALVAIACGIILVIVVFAVVNFINNRDTKTNSDPSISTQLPNPNKDYGKAPEQSAPSPEVTPSTPTVEPNHSNNNVSSNTTVNVNDWIEIPVYEGITWSSEKIDSTFYITSKKHYLKVIDDSNFEIKTVLYGALSGFTGTYELEVPYTVGIHKDLPVGESFKVKVQFGTDTTGKTVVGQIEI